MFGLAYEAVADEAALRGALRAALARPGATLVEASVDPRASASQGEALQRACRAALAG